MASPHIPNLDPTPTGVKHKRRRVADRLEVVAAIIGREGRLPSADDVLEAGDVTDPCRPDRSARTRSLEAAWDQDRGLHGPVSGAIEAGRDPVHQKSKRYVLIVSVP